MFRCFGGGGGPVVKGAAPVAEQGQACVLAETTQETLSRPSDVLPVSESRPSLTTPQTSSVSSVPAARRSGDAVLLASHGLDDKRKSLAAEWHQEHQGSMKMSSEAELLKDVKLTSILGTGGFATCYMGFWRGGTTVAVKVMLTKAADMTAEQKDFASGVASVNGKAVTEAILSRNLCHPHVVACYDVRGAILTAPFLAAAYAGHAATPKELMKELQDWGPLAASKAAGGTGGLSMTELIQEVQELQREWVGVTPLLPIPGQEQPDQETLNSMSGDGFGAAGDNGPTLSWKEVLRSLHAAPGDSIIVSIMQYADCGTLEAAVLKGVFKCDHRAAVQGNADARRRLRALIRTAKEVAAGLEHLHANKVVHADLKPANVLLQSSRRDTRGFVPQLSDFGLSTVVANSKSVHGSGSGTVQYMAPEVFAQGASSYKSDVYAWGIMLWTMITRTCPYQGMTPGQVCMAVVRHNQRPQWPANAYPRLHQIYDRCVAADPAQRPTATEVVQFLSKTDDELRATLITTSTGGEAAR